MKYITAGAVRGSCGHHHQTIYAAAKCLAADQRDCARSGGYSDRRVMALGSDGKPQKLDNSEAIRVGTILMNMSAVPIR